MIIFLTVLAYLIAIPSLLCFIKLRLKNIDDLPEDQQGRLGCLYMCSLTISILSLAWIISFHLHAFS